MQSSKKVVVDHENEIVTYEFEKGEQIVLPILNKKDPEANLGFYSCNVIHGGKNQHFFYDTQHQFMLIYNRSKNLEEFISLSLAIQ